MDQNKRVDRVLDAVASRVESEVAALLGVSFKINDAQRTPLYKADIFEALSGKQVCCDIDIVGEVAGKSCLLVGIRDAIRLGGTLIMLPSSEMEEVCGREEYTEEVKDSYGEIANIIAGSFTKDFEEMYPKSCRFVRKEQEIIIPAKVDADGEWPVPNQLYYQLSYTMLLEGKTLGNLIMLLPAAAFELAWEGMAEIGAQAAEEASEQQTKNAAKEGPASPPAEDSGQEKGGKTVPAAADAEAEITPTKSAEPSSPPSPAAPSFNLEKHRKRVDRLLAECQVKVEKEVGALIGADLKLTDLQNNVISKEDLFYDQLSGRQICADMEVVGELQDKSYLFVNIKDAIRLGGTLIMLPDAELENVVASDEFGDDVRDAYGEVSNIISGVYTAIFEEQYTKKLRYIRKEIRDIQPMKVDIESDQPVPNISFYVSSMTLSVGGTPCGRIQMVFPAAMLQLEELMAPAAAETSDTPNITQKKQVATEEEQGPATITQKKSDPQATTGEAGVVDSPPPSSAGGLSPAEADQLDKHRKRIDKLLLECQNKMTSEVSALLGADVQFCKLENSVVSKEEFFFEKVSGKQMLASMDVAGELDGKSYLTVRLKDAIRIGGVLIMLPESELDSVVGEEQINDDIADAYGEVANIIAGVYSGIFEEQYTRKIRFIKTGISQVTPMKVDPAADEPIGGGDYYLSSMDLVIDGQTLGKVNLLFPLPLLELEGLKAVAGQQVQDVSRENIAAAAKTEPSGRGPASGENRPDSPADSYPDILVIRDDEREADKIAAVLTAQGYTVKILTFKDNVHNHLPGRVKGIYLVMEEVNEQVFGMAIKISAACLLPLIAAGPDWTRSKVIKAVKYGIRDILLTPAADRDINENVSRNILKMAA